MTALIKADLYRILHKRTLWIIIGITALIETAVAVYNRTRVWNGFVFVDQEISIALSLSGILIGTLLFISVYSDEFTARSMQTVIGRGLSRTKVILAKIISCVIIAFLVYLLTLLFLLFLSVVLGARMTAADAGYLSLSVLQTAYCTAGNAALAAVVIYLTGNHALSVFVNIALIALLPNALFLMESSVLMKNLHPSYYTLQGFAERGVSDLMLTGDGTGTLIFGFVFYMGIAFLLSVLVFRRRELEF